MLLPPALIGPARCDGNRGWEPSTAEIHGDSGWFGDALHEVGGEGVSNKMRLFRSPRSRFNGCQVDIGCDED